ncbi:hypothetical protein BJ165DRAFT_1498538 [Panaeolus papilionaceus]|nr:hypothetical protein BJ165DRAFT_1498538 [Panaeolus papilionaceus]
MVAVRDDGVVNSSSPYLPLLLSPRLRELDLIFYGDHFLKPISQIQAANISVFLQAISTRTALDSLSWLTDSAPHDTIVEPISTIQTLTQLHLSINDRRHLIHLSTLSSLLTLHLNMAHASNNLEMSVAPKTSFSSLQTLYLHADFDSFNQITSLLRSSKLHTFSMTLIDVSTPVDPASHPTWAQLFGRFPVQMPNLKILALKKQEDGDEVYLPWSACTELLKLQRLTIVDLSALFIMELSAEQFEDLPSTWKDLEDCIIPSDDGAVFEYFKPLSSPLTRVSFLSADL